jgi:superfamily I DNA/RNA helicase
MTVFRNLYGPPGSGKSRVLKDLFVKLASQVGPERIGAVTYTRAGASVLRERVGAALGLKGNDAELARKMPWVGTIHSIALKLSGESRNRIVDKAKLKEFAPSFDGYIPSIEYMDTLSLAEPGYDTDEIEAMLWCLSASRHRMISLGETFSLLDPHTLQRISPERILGLVQEYETWKSQHGYLDFEDMLDLGKCEVLPVKALLCDEVQDNTPLLYSVLQAWEKNTDVSVFAGDPYQAIYHFAGASPDLFLNRPGEWTTIGNSHRFNQQTADYARRIIENTYGTDPRLHTWEGVGGQRDGGGHRVLPGPYSGPGDRESQRTDRGGRGLSPHGRYQPASAEVGRRVPGLSATAPGRNRTPH